MEGRPSPDTALPRSPRRAALALALLIPAPTIGILFAIVYFPNAFFGKVVYALCKIWLLALPAAWHVRVDGEKLAPSRPSRRGMPSGVVSGLVVSAVIVIAYLAVGASLIDTASLREKVHALGLRTPFLFVAGSVYGVLVNSLLEEYVWRWFVVRQFERLMSARAAVVASALAFTLHHVVVLFVYVPAEVAVISSCGVFAGGLLWSWLYERTRSLWPCYVSHAMVDAAIMGVGYHLVFGGGM